MKIAYFVAGEGNGHATRSTGVIQELKKRGHEVIAVSDSNAIPVLSRVCQVVEAVTPHMIYNKNSVAAMQTLRLNLFALPKFFRDLKRVKRLIAGFRPDLIITDFNPMACFIRKVPIISLDNQGIISEGRYNIPKGWWMEWFKSIIVVKAFTRANARLITCFFNVQVKHISSKIVGPILSKEVKALKPRNGKHLLVYQTSNSNQVLAGILQQIGVGVKAYGFSREGRIGNIEFIPFNREQWFKDLASCKAVIINGGYSLMTEALALRKPILSFPVHHQFEQVLNAYYLEREGLGVWGKKQDLETIRAFLQIVPSLKKRLAKKEWSDGACEAADEIEGLINGNFGKK